MKEKIILYKARKHEPTMQEIKKLIKQRGIVIAHPSFDFMEKILSNFPMYKWRIYVGNDVSPLCPNVYFYYRDLIRKNHKTVRSISMDRKIENNEIYPLGWVSID